MASSSPAPQTPYSPARLAAFLNSQGASLSPEAKVNAAQSFLRSQHQISGEVIQLLIILFKEAGKHLEQAQTAQENESKYQEYAQSSKICEDTLTILQNSLRPLLRGRVFEQFTELEQTFAQLLLILLARLTSIHVTEWELSDKVEQKFLIKASVYSAEFLQLYPFPSPGKFLNDAVFASPEPQLPKQPFESGYFWDIGQCYTELAMHVNAKGSSEQLANLEVAEKAFLLAYDKDKTQPNGTYNFGWLQYDLGCEAEGEEQIKRFRWTAQLWQHKAETDDLYARMHFSQLCLEQRFEQYFDKVRKYLEEFREENDFPLLQLCNYCRGLLHEYDGDHAQDAVARKDYYDQAENFFQKAAAETDKFVGHHDARRHLLFGYLHGKFAAEKGQKIVLDIHTQLIHLESDHRDNDAAALLKKLEEATTIEIFYRSVCNARGSFIVPPTPFSLRASTVKRAGVSEGIALRVRNAPCTVNTPRVRSVFEVASRRCATDPAVDSRESPAPRRLTYSAALSVSPLDFRDGQNSVAADGPVAPVSAKTPVRGDQSGALLSARSLNPASREASLGLQRFFTDAATSPLRTEALEATANAFPVTGEAKSVQTSPVRVVRSVGLARSSQTSPPAAGPAKSSQTSPLVAVASRSLQTSPIVGVSRALQTSFLADATRSPHRPRSGSEMPQSTHLPRVSEAGQRRRDVCPVDGSDDDLQINQECIHLRRVPLQFTRNPYADSPTESAGITSGFPAPRSTDTTTSSRLPPTIAYPEDRFSVAEPGPLGAVDDEDAGIFDVSAGASADYNPEEEGDWSYRSAVGSKSGDPSPTSIANPHCHFSNIKKCANSTSNSAKKFSDEIADIDALSKKYSSRYTLQLKDAYYETDYMIHLLQSRNEKEKSRAYLPPRISDFLFVLTKRICSKIKIASEPANADLVKNISYLRESLWIFAENYEKNLSCSLSAFLLTAATILTIATATEPKSALTAASRALELIHALRAMPHVTSDSLEPYGPRSTGR